MVACNENFERKKSQMFVKFSFICLNHLKSVDRRKSNFSFKYINFAAFWTLSPVVAAILSPTPHPRSCAPCLLWSSFLF
jgi:hypothetical protein